MKKHNPQAGDLRKPSPLGTLPHGPKKKIATAICKLKFLPPSHKQLARYLVRIAVVCLMLCPPVRAQESASSSCETIPRRIPPVGIELPHTQLESWRAQLASLTTRLDALDSDFEADVAVLLKACNYALDFQEIYRESDSKKVDRLLRLAETRIQELASITPAQRSALSWLGPARRQVRGFRSRVDGSVQPIGLVLPQKWKNTLDSPSMPLYVWLHGRGDKTTDLHFLCDRLDKDGQITPSKAIVLHPFGRQCIGYKSAGETDVMEAIDFVCENYPVDPKRIVLMGFSMGGAGVWHLAAHYGERFVAASPGAGFAETARYQRLNPKDFPPTYEQMLWSIYDVPGYTTNLFNLPLVAYSGEKDKQIQAARVMEEAFQAEGRVLPHLIGPGMGHKYHPDTLAEILERMASATAAASPKMPNEFFVQTHHLRYGSRNWLTIDGMHKQYSDTRVHARRGADFIWQLNTKNVSRLIIDATHAECPQSQINIDGTLIALQENVSQTIEFIDGSWRRAHPSALRKHRGLCGPIDDAFLDSFLVVPPNPSMTTGKSQFPTVDSWVRCEFDYQESRWRSLFRGQWRQKPAAQVSPADMKRHHLVLWGTPASNPLIAKLLAARSDTLSHQLPLKWDEQSVRLGGASFSSVSHVPVLIFPNPFSPSKYVVLNSGPTFRTSHDRTNSLQNPHLPDWAIISMEQPRSAEQPGKIARTGFFNNQWTVSDKLQW